MSASGPGLRLEPARVTDFARLIAAISGIDLPSVPVLAPALLFSDSKVQRQLDMPRPGPNEVVVQDYQSVRHMAALAVGDELSAAVTRPDRGTTTEFDITLSHAARPCVVLKTALRRVPRQDFTRRNATRFTPGQIAGDAGRVDGLCIPQAQVNAYLGLSGDRNPIHSDPTEAASLGFGAPIVPGLLLLALVQPFAPAGRATAFRGRFMAPLMVDQPFSISLTHRGPGRLRAFIFTSNAGALALADMQGIG